MGDELPILKGILNGVVNYHNARMYLSEFSYQKENGVKGHLFVFFFFFLIGSDYIGITFYLTKP